MLATLEYLRGITPDDARRLRSLGIRHTLDLLHLTTLAIDRERISKRTGIPEPRLVEFANQCALLEISGIERHITVLRRLGVTSQKALKRAEPKELQERIVNAVGANGAPTLGQVEYWISQARSIDVLEDERVAEPPVQVSSPSLL